MPRFETFFSRLRANLGVILVVGLLPALAILGLVTDYARWQREEKLFQRALDETAQMLAGQPLAHDAARLEAYAQGYFRKLAAQYRIRPTSSLKVTQSAGAIRLSTSGAVVTSIGPLFSVNEWHFSVSTQAAHDGTMQQVAAAP